MGSTVDDYTRLSAGASIGEGLVVRGEEAHDAQSEVKGWLQRIGLLDR